MGVLSQVFFIARKDLHYMFRARETWLWAFLMPLVFFYLLGAITSGLGRQQRRAALALVAPADAGFLVERFQQRLEKHFRVVRVQTGSGASGFRRRLVVPARFTEQVLAGRPAQVRLVLAGEGLAEVYDRWRVMRAVYSVLADLIVTSKDGAVPSRETLLALDQKPRTLALVVERAGRLRRPPTGFEQAVPGTMVMFLMLTMLATAGVWLVIEREQGILRRLAAAPLSRGVIVAGKCASRCVLGWIQMTFAMAAGALVFGVHWGPHWPLAAGLLAVYVALTAMLGVLVGNLARTEHQALGSSVIATNLLAALGGCWWPIEITPPWAQKLALLLPTGWAMDALHKLVSFGEPPAAVLPHLFVTAAAALLAGWAAARAFRFR